MRSNSPLVAIDAFAGLDNRARNGPQSCFRSSPGISFSALA
jgi:hypothetical protein